MMLVSLENWIDADRRLFRTRKHTSPAGSIGIKDALEKGVTGIIKAVNDQNREDIFYMLCFCLAVPQSKAVKAEEAISVLRNRDFYSIDLSLSELCSILMSRVRFQNRKSEYIRDAKKTFLEDSFWSELKKSYDWHIAAPSKEERNKGLHRTRNWLVKTFKGMGMKEASHYMRNIGMSGLAILDVHIISGLQKRGLISGDKIDLNKTNYLSIEEVFIEYANKVGISLDELDLLLWSEKTGYVFK